MDSTKINGRLSADDIKRKAAGRWREILQAVCGLSDSQLNPKVHGPCPKCGGTDRFRALDDVAETGGMFCSQCFSTRNGDGFAAVQWLNNVTFNGALKLVADAIGQTSNGHHKTATAKPASTPKAIHPTAEKAADALAWSMVQSGILTVQRGPDAEWRYHNADGSDAGAVLRWNLPDDRKEIRQVSCVPGGWITSGMAEPRPLYRLPELIEAAEVWVSEGEKSADAAIGLGLVATTSAGGSQAAEKSDWTPLDGKRVCILPDNDKAGEKFAAEVVDLIRRHAPNATVSVKRLVDDWPEIPEAGDVYDYSEHFDGQDAETLRNRLQELPDRCGEFDIQTDEPDSENEESTPLQLVFHDAWKAADKPRPMRECIIEGMLRRGEVGNFIASTKTGKSWFALMLLICIATGRDWLGRRVARGNVLLIDNELHEETLENRISAVQFAMKTPSDSPRDRFEYVACRGNWVSIQDLIKAIPEQYPPGSLNLICIDAKYRLFGNGLEENSNDDQTTFHNLIDVFARTMNCPIVLVHHATKGDQSGKAVTDIGSGGGSQSRTVDLHMTIRPHQQPGFAVMDAALRSFVPVEPVTLRWNWPLWSVANDVEAVLPKDPRDSERYTKMKANVLKYLNKEWQSLAKLAERCSTKKDRNPFADILEELHRQKLIEIDENFIPKNSKRVTTGVRQTSDKITSDNCPESLSERPD